MIWGPGDTRTLKMYKGIAKKKFPLIGSGKTLVHWILVSDLAKAFRLLSETDITNEIYIISGRESVSLEHMLIEIANALEVSPPRIKIPAYPVQLIGSIVEALCKPIGVEPPIYRRRVDFFTKTRSFNSDKARKDFGFNPEFSFKEEVKLIAEWYREHGWV